MRLPALRRRVGGVSHDRDGGVCHAHGCGRTVRDRVSEAQGVGSVAARDDLMHYRGRFGTKACVRVHVCCA